MKPCADRRCGRRGHLLVLRFQPSALRFCDKSGIVVSHFHRKACSCDIAFFMLFQRESQIGIFRVRKIKRQQKLNFSVVILRNSDVVIRKRPFLRNPYCSEQQRILSRSIQRLKKRRKPVDIVFDNMLDIRSYFIQRIQNKFFGFLKIICSFWKICSRKMLRNLSS